MRSISSWRQRFSYLGQRMFQQKVHGKNDMKTKLRRCLTTPQLTFLGAGNTIVVGISFMLGVKAKENADLNMFPCPCICNGACPRCCPMMSPQAEGKKIFNDPIHGTMELHPACVAIINTPQFERLRHIKQLGVCYYVYPGASHNRLEHSIGVCYLAGKFLRTLRKNQPDLEITDKDILCVEIAGLCHDLGHGPFSHVFDQVIIPKFPEIEPKNWTHEKASVEMLRHLISENKLMDPKENGILLEYGLDSTDITFIEELIDGDPNARPNTGRGEKKAFLYEIISNKRNGIDVDKWDYLARDSLYLGIKTNFDHKRYMKFARVIKGKRPLDEVDTWQICIRDKEISNLYHMFFSRFTLHKSAYQHRVTKTIEIMLANALFKVNGELKFEGEDGKLKKMSECIHDMRAYSKLTDNVLLEILGFKSQRPDQKMSKEMADARALIESILSRDLYQLVYESGSLVPIDKTKLKKEISQIKTDIITKFNSINDLDGEKYEEEDLEILHQILDCGMNNKDQVKNILVYKKGKNEIASQLDDEQASRFLGPETVSQHFISVLTSKRDHMPTDKLKEAAKSVLEKRSIKFQKQTVQNQETEQHSQQAGPMEQAGPLTAS